jgi:hypothetical protein
MYKIRWEATVFWVPDGAGAMSVNSAQSLTQTTKFGANGGAVSVPGADAPTTANITTACATVGANIAAALNANIGEIQGFATGGG